MEEISRAPMVTIPLQEYDKLRDKANEHMHMMERIIGMGNELQDIGNRVYQLEQKR